MSGIKTINYSLCARHKELRCLNVASISSLTKIILCLRFVNECIRIFLHH